VRSALRQPRFWLGMAVSVVALLYAVRGVSWPELATALRQADYRWLAPGLVVVVAGQVARTVRWRALFGDGPRPRLVPAFEILCVGYMVSAVFPLRLGDPLRAWLIQTRTRADGATALATIMAERAIDFLMIAVLVALLVPAHASLMLTERLGPGPWSEPANLAVIAMGLAALVYAGMLVAAAAGPRLARAVASGLESGGAPPGLARRVGAATARFAGGFGPLRRGRTLGLVTAWTLAVWLLGAASNWVFLRAFVPDGTFGAALLVLGVTGLFAVLPSSPGYAGVFHSAVVIALAALGDVPRPTALAYAIVLHGVTILALIALGIGAVWTLGLRGSDLGRTLDAQATAGGPGSHDDGGRAALRSSGRRR